MPAIDTERFRLRNFVDKLVDLGECEVRNEPIDLVDVAAHLDGNPRAVSLQGGWTRKGRTGRQRDGLAQAAGARARHR